MTDLAQRLRDEAKKPSDRYGWQQVLVEAADAIDSLTEKLGKADNISTEMIGRAGQRLTALESEHDLRMAAEARLSRYEEFAKHIRGEWFHETEQAERIRTALAALPEEGKV